jgi:hypothetical protein
MEKRNLAEWEESRDWVRDDFEAHVNAVYASADD